MNHKTSYLYFEIITLLAQVNEVKLVFWTALLFFWLLKL